VVDEDDLHLAAVIAVDHAGQGVDAVAHGQPAPRPHESDVAGGDLDEEAGRDRGPPARGQGEGLRRAQVGAGRAFGRVLGEGAGAVHADLERHGRGL
jgi:hypothetical protein